MSDETKAATPSEEATPAPGTPAPTKEGTKEGEQTPPKEPAANQVSVPKERLDQLEKDAARASTAQSEADKWKRKFESKSAKHAPEALAFTDAELADLHREINSKLLSDPDFATAINKIPAVKDILTSKNPLAFLGTSEFVDVEDAIEQLKEYLDDNFLNLDILKNKPEEKKPESKGEEAEETKTPAPAPANTPDSDDTPKGEEDPKPKSKVFKNDGVQNAEDSILAKTKGAMNPGQE